MPSPHPDPQGSVLHYLDLLKPGGGLGVVIPHWRYAWPAHTDNQPWGHRWNTCPEVGRAGGRPCYKRVCGLRFASDVGNRH